MKRFCPFQLVAFLLAGILCLPPPASDRGSREPDGRSHALRPLNPKDSPPLEQELRTGLEEQGGGGPKPSALDWLNYGLINQRQDHPEEAIEAFGNALKADRSSTEAWIGLTRAIIEAHKPPASAAGRNPWPRRVAQFHSVWARLMKEAAARGTDSETLLKILAGHREEFAQIDLTPEQFLTILLGPARWRRGGRISYRWDELAPERLWFLGGFSAAAVELRSMDPKKIQLHMGFRLKDLGFTNRDFRSSTPSFLRMITRMFQALETRAGLEEAAARAVAAAEGWVRMRGAGKEDGARALVLDAASLEVAPGLAGLAVQLGKSRTFGGRVVLWGALPQGMELPGVAQAPTPDDLSVWLGRQAKEGGVAAVTFVGLEERAPLVRALAKARGLGFTPRLPSWIALLAAFVPEPLARELAAGLEEAELLGAGA